MDFMQLNSTNNTSYFCVSKEFVLFVFWLLGFSITGFVNSRILLYNYQSSFRKNHSTDFCLSLLNDKILKGFDPGLITGIILIDLQKAFDKIDHDILLQKLYTTGFSKYSVYWFRSSLINRAFLLIWGMHFLNLHVCPVVYRKDLFLVLYSFS